MNSKDKVIVPNLEESIEKLSKNLYLESPDLWIEFSGKMSDNIFDEMVLFFAIRYNYLPIIKHAISNNLINLDSPSRNNSFANVKEHLLSIAKKNDDKDILKYLKSPLGSNIPIEDVTKENKELASSNHSEVESNLYFPEYLCKSCESNVFESGYKVSESIGYKFSPHKNKVLEVSRDLCGSIICSNCNKELEGISLEYLNNLSNVQNCVQCGSNLTTVGIVDKSKMLFDNNLGTFTNLSKSYHCSKCDMKITENQKIFFSL